MKTKKTYLSVGTVPKTNRKLVETKTKSTAYTPFILLSWYWYFQ